jgi:hypothetical protein
MNEWKKEGMNELFENLEWRRCTTTIKGL